MATNSAPRDRRPDGQPLDVLGERRVAGLDRAEAGDEAALTRARGERRHRRRHRHPVVALAVEAGATKRASDTGDGQGVPVDRGAGTEGLDHVRHGQEPVDLFDPELSDVGEDGRALGDGSGDGEDGNLVERGNLAGSYLRGGQGAGQRPDRRAFPGRRG